jgi:iron complex transport system substrate-binding protein
MRGMKFCRAFLLLCMLLSAGLVHAQGGRLVSMNVCTDQLLLLLVPPARIASLSYFATDPAYSNLAEQATNIPSNRGQADAIAALQPSLILTSAFSATFAANLLERLGHRVQRLGFANSVDGVYAQITQVAAWTDTQAQADAIVAELRQQITAQQTQLRTVLAGKSAVFISSNGIAYGSGTLHAAFLQSLGLRNIASDAGLVGPAALPLETLLQAAPDYLLTEARGTLDTQLVNRYLQHPALQRLPTRTLHVRERWFDCAGPWLQEAYASVAAQVLPQTATGNAGRSNVD